MDVREVRVYKKDLETAIKLSIQSFEEKTNTTVKNIELKDALLIKEMRRHTTNVEVMVTI